LEGEVRWGLQKIDCSFFPHPLHLPLGKGERGVIIPHLMGERGVIIPHLKGECGVIIPHLMGECGVIIPDLMDKGQYFLTLLS